MMMLEAAASQSNNSNRVQYGGGESSIVNSSAEALIQDHQLSIANGSHENNKENESSKNNDTWNNSNKTGEQITPCNKEIDYDITSSNPPTTLHLGNFHKEEDVENNSSNCSSVKVNEGVVLPDILHKLSKWFPIPDELKDYFLGIPYLMNSHNFTTILNERAFENDTNRVLDSWDHNELIET